MSKDTFIYVYVSNRFPCNCRTCSLS